MNVNNLSLETVKNGETSGTAIWCPAAPLSLGGWNQLPAIVFFPSVATLWGSYGKSKGVV